MRDVAAAAGVSLKTVSRVVNGEDHVAGDTSARVTRAIAELGYRVDDRARRLRQLSPTTGTIGFVLVDVANPFFAAILRGLEEVAHAHDHLVVSGSSDGDLAREHALIEAFASHRVDGLVVTSSELRDGPLRAELDRGTPVVIVDLEPDEHVADVVRSDHRAGGRLATEHLLAHGHRDIAFWGDAEGVSSADERRRGFDEALAAAGVTPRPDRIVRHGASSDEWYELARDRLGDRDRPTAIFSAQNLVTLGLVRALHEHGLERRIAVVGHDDVPFATVVEPGITVVPQRPFEIGRRAAARLFARIDGDDGPPVRDLLAPVLVARGSGELPSPGAA